MAKPTAIDVSSNEIIELSFTTVINSNSKMIPAKTIIKGIIQLLDV